eukprot:920628-Rhodomonas_salina.1
MCQPACHTITACNPATRKKDPPTSIESVTPSDSDRDCHTRTTTETQPSHSRLRMVLPAFAHVVHPWHSSVCLRIGRAAKRARRTAFAPSLLSH